MIRHSRFRYVMLHAKKLHESIDRVLLSSVHFRVLLLNSGSDPLVSVVQGDAPNMNSVLPLPRSLQRRHAVVPMSAAVDLGSLRLGLRTVRVVVGDKIRRLLALAGKMLP